MEEKRNSVQSGQHRWQDVDEYEAWESTDWGRRYYTAIICECSICGKKTERLPMEELEADGCTGKA